MVSSRRQDGRVIHNKMLYLGKLSGLDGHHRKLLAKRIESLLSHQYMMPCDDERIERLAIKYAGKYQSKFYGRGHARGATASGGCLADPHDDLQAISLKSFNPVRVREGGAEWLCWQVMEQMGLFSFMEGDLGLSAKTIDLVSLNLLGRLLYPTSELKTAKWLAGNSGALELSEASPRSVHDRALGQAALELSNHHQEIEDYVYNYLDERLGFGDIPMLYDLTNTYFEGRMLGCDLATYGRSKEKRSDAPLVSIGLLTNELGFIRRSHFYAGNVHEADTLSDVLAYVQQHNGMIMDAGIATRENIESLAVAQVPYMCVVRQGFKEHQTDFTQAYHFVHSCSNGTKYSIWLELHQHTFEVDGQQYEDQLLFVKSEQKKAKEDSIIQGQKGRFEKGLNAIKESLLKPRGHKSIQRVNQRIGRLRARHGKVSKAFKIQTKNDGINVLHIDWQYDAALEKRNGAYIIRTSMPITDEQQAWKAYHTLSRIEAVNRCCKTDLNMRPVYHQNDQSVKAHLFLTLLACSIVQFVRFQLQKQGITHSWKEIVRIMNGQKTVLARFSNLDEELFLLAKWSEPEAPQKEIYEALQLKHQPYEGFFFKIQQPHP